MEYRSPLTSRYLADPALSAMFSQESRADLAGRLWYSLAVHSRALGAPIPKSALEAFEKALEAPVDLARVRALEEESRHDIWAKLQYFEERTPEVRGFLHWGATSSFIADNSDLIIQKRALRRIRQTLVEVLERLVELAEREAFLPTPGWTHWQEASTITWGLRVAGWAQDLEMDLDEILRLESEIRFLGCRGPVGTAGALLELFDGSAYRVQRLQERIAGDFGFAPDRVWEVSGQTYPRKWDSRVSGVLAGIAESALKFSGDIRFLASQGALAEEFGDSQVGSSAMPWKRNPIKSERLGSLARHAKILAGEAGWTYSAQGLERTLDDSAGRRIYLPELFLTISSVLDTWGGIAGGLRLRRPEEIPSRTSEIYAGQSESLLIRASVAGVDRSRAHRVLLEESARPGDPTPEFQRRLGLENEDLESSTPPWGMAGELALRKARALERKLEAIGGEDIDGGPL